MLQDVGAGDVGGEGPEQSDVRARVMSYLTYVEGLQVRCVGVTNEAIMADECKAALRLLLASPRSEGVSGFPCTRSYVFLCGFYSGGGTWYAQHTP